ncbi:MAG: ABC-F family ATP-binding cassette domain-containing protein [Pedobacter sp.]|nr:MAG: ABC-F family ATP-binding cassette domain-containing protein [Pedobacter sp.]
MLTLQGLAYLHPNRDILFSNLNFTLQAQNKVALVGHNGSGKSTLLNLLAGTLQVNKGLLHAEDQPYLVPQIFGQFNHLSIAEALKINDRITALHEILDGKATEENFALLQDDWTIEERCHEAFAYWGLEISDLNQKLDLLSGGQKTKVFLAGIFIHQPEIILMDEPSNHLDVESRHLLYRFIQETNKTLLIVSHDRILLNLLNLTYELNQGEINTYGGNYDFYLEQKQIEEEALANALKAKEKTLRKAKVVARETIEREQKLDARGKRKQEKAGLPTISMNTLKNKAEGSTARVKQMHGEKISNISKELTELRSTIPLTGQMKIGFDQSNLHYGKILIEAREINFAYGNNKLWLSALNFEIKSGERIALKGINGSGKSTLIKIILGELLSQTGTLKNATYDAIYVDQDYSLINNQLTVYLQAQQYNTGELQEHEIKIRLNRFLFNKEDWDKSCSALSGGEKMRLMLCLLTIKNKAPDMIIFDEPTNNLDIQNVEILTEAINEFKGTLLVVSHDSYFLEQINIEREIVLDK